MDARGVPRSEIARRLGVSRNTVAKYADAEDMSPAAPLPQERPHPATDAHAAWIDSVLEADLGRSGQLVALEGVTGIGEAERLVGHALLARVDDLPEGFEAHDVDALLGREVVDEKSGPLGSIVEVMVGPANDVWVVDGPLGEVLLPVVESVVVDASGEGPIRVLAPEGLLEGGE